MPSPPLTLLGDFQVLREIGRGGMGVVYEARQVSLNRLVALKVLSGGLGLTPRAVERFRREAEAAAKLHHTNIVPVYATGEQDGTHYYAMELIDGPSLDHVLARLRRVENPTTTSDGELAPDLAQTGPYVPKPAADPSETPTSSLHPGEGYFDSVARMMAEVADALEHAHQQGVLHRDMKPSNLLLSSAGRLSVNDFGLARMLEQPGMTMTGEFVGTPAYMSPEQITAGRTQIDHRTDVYSLGATLYEMLTLSPPFTGDRRDQVLAQILHKDPPPPRKVNRQVPIDLETICLKALEKDPDRRYPSAGAMAEDLRRYFNRFAIAARRAGPVERLRKWVKRHPGLSAALACLLVTALTAGFFAYLTWRGHQERLADEKRYADERQAERRHAAMEGALEAAMRGESESAYKAIQEAERLDAPEGEVAFLHGMVTYYQGREAEAVVHLERAVRTLDPGASAAARGLLTLAYDATGRGNDVDRSLIELEDVSPVTLIDHLFKGSAIALADPEQGLALLDQAVASKRSSAVARLLRANARSNLAQDKVDPRMADLALDDVLNARSNLKDESPVAFTESGWHHLIAAGVYESAGWGPSRERAVAQAREDCLALKPFTNRPGPVLTRVTYYWYHGEKDQVLDESRRFARRPDHPVLAVYHALPLYWRGRPGDLEEARDVLREHPDNPQALLIRCCLRAELDGAAAALKDLQKGSAPKLRGFHKVRLLMLLLLMGREDLAREESKRDLARRLSFPPVRRTFFQQLLTNVAGGLREESLLRAAADSRSMWNVSLARQFIAMHHIGSGRRKDAREALEAVIATRNTGNSTYDLCQVFLERMRKDDRWPAWVQPKE